jgi:micrococcal nuclease
MPAPLPTVAQRGANCEPSYPTLCILIGSPDLDCPDIDARRFPVAGADPHRFDGDGNGVGCERD